MRFLLTEGYSVSKGDDNFTTHLDVYAVNTC